MDKKAPGSVPAKAPPTASAWSVIQGLFPRRESPYRAYREANSQVTSSCVARHLPLKCHSPEGGTRFHVRKTLTTWSPLTESNRRPSPYHAHFPGFTARQALPAGRRQALIWVLPRPAASATAQAIAPTAGAAAGTGLCRRAAAPTRACAAIQARPVGLHAGQPRPLQRSNDGQTIFPIPPAQGPKTTLSRRFPISRKNLNQCPYLYLNDATGGSPEVLPSPRSHRGTCRTQSQATCPPERGQ